MLQKVLEGISAADKRKIREAKEHLDSLIKPPGSLGVLEEIGMKIAGITGKLENDFDKKIVLIFAADNGVHQEGIAASPKEITHIQAINMVKGLAGISVLAQEAGADIRVIDIGIDGNVEENSIIKEKIAYGTKNILEEDAMSISEAINAIEVGIKAVNWAKENGYQLIGTGEMGIGNSTTSSAILSAVAKLPGEDTVGYGAGLSIEDYQHKINVVNKVLMRYAHEEEQMDIIKILCRFGGFDIAGMTGVFLAASYYRIPVVVDGFISAVSALLAYKLNENVKDYLLFSHASTEPGFKIIEEIIGLKAPLMMEMRLGEGSGCPIMFKIIDSSMAIIKNMGRLADGNISKEILVDIRE
ncbi:MAG: nicotinate-nucleotide--dimethylbenzimidazole phosphoribosyltransferase [Fusobacteria bacterium]|nr:nicotinate-nucleotide--dimethylbenzimidazole phosphoribosyltransferase [Fusobacteriota bacterium]